MATTLASQVQELYVGYLGRAADKAGLDFWVKAIENGTSTLESVALGFTLSEEYKAQYNGLTTTQLVAKVYQNVLGRAADADGLAFWAGEVNKGVIKADTLVKSMINSLGAIDQLTIDNKVTAANAYTIAAGANYNVEAGKAAVLNAGATLPGANNPGQTFTLTTAVGENVVGTTGNDTFKAVYDGAAGANGTWNLGDFIDGKDGTDTLEVLVTATAGNTPPVGTTIQNVEIVKFTHAGATAAGALDLKSSSFAGVKELWQIDKDAAADNFEDVVVAAGVIAGFESTGNKDTAAALTTTVKVGAASGTQKTLEVALKGIDGATGGSGLTFDGAGVETITIKGDVTTNAANDFTLTEGTAVGVKTLNIGLTSNTEIKFAATNFDAVTKFDASASTGNITADLSVLTTAGKLLKTVVGGTGGDIFTVDVGNGVAAVNVNTGAGNDTLTLKASATIADADASITLGAGKDTLTIGAAGGLANITADPTTVAELTAKLVTVTDFKAAEDVLSIKAASPVVFDAAQVALIAGQADLLAATKKAAELAGASKTVVFGFGTDSYVYQNDAQAAVDAGDGLVKLTGVNVNDFNSAFNGNLVVA